MTAPIPDPAKRYLLYRGETLLGWFPEQSIPKGKKLIAGAMGYLQMSDPSLEITGVMQTRIGPFPPHVPEMVHQSPVEPVDPSTWRTHRQDTGDGRILAKMEVGLQLEDSAPVPTVAREELLRIGMPDGSILDPHMVHIHQYIVSAEHEAETRRLAGVASGPLWSVMFAHHDTSEEEMNFAKLP